MSDKTVQGKVMTDEQRAEWRRSGLFPIELWGDSPDSTPLECPMPDRALLRALAESIPKHVQLSGWYPARQSGGFQNIYADNFSGMGRQAIACAPSGKSYFGELAEFIAAACPRTVLRLLDRIDELERAVLAASEQAKDAERQQIGEAINRFFGDNDNGDGTFAFDPFDARDVDLLIDAIAAAGNHKVEGE